ncbi:mandelate racemase/muconate lactonizing enzyme [Amycolatopsis mediterranei S699]|uniref:Mandelate racemase/muconate lactonizing enzyme n=2 Tax=Amycolatopsis mediterranei TaxID=33910 RepID=A0A9R0UBA9_AMYMS|nr:mandelate racemase/muconate lactonizing enzyme family protein [Amycolatopsis mediterranei]ADJ47944.1 putative mandelate racemase/muconate lactonizing enzyme [Amycolatopsis mediterranei U32]AEK44844.1 mandelate racemase/muconate lactonizing enzyme [Amycolatopsis mediterranei S699]AFO79655.1 mandelate racemase/muconate lactonizing enzyme [Amycolatopsis mediterranei S699]AGT86783.1 mandelate racemase/muconate lactonizing enzyme [Amycolatopsis mediterranei RB]KDO10765.1 isomerase [Amycolatopsis
MKITAITLDRLRPALDPPLAAAWDPEPRRHFDATIVRVHTDDGITGIGSGDTMAGFEAVEHLFLGEDPLDIVRHVKAIETANFHGGCYWPLEVALWDVIGQVAGLPVATLFGNSARSLPAYASSAELKPPAERVETALRAREAGFRAMKIRIDRNRVDEGVAAVAAVRDALGADFGIMVDLNQSWRMAGDTAPASDLAKTRKLVRRLAELDVFWVEEPLPYNDIAGFKTLRAENPGLRIAAGEMHHSVPELLRYLEEDVLDVYQMDVVLAVGMHRARTLAELAQLKHRAFTPHSWTNGIGVLANLHVSAGVGGGPFFEFPWDPPGWTPERRDFMLTEPVMIDARGELAVPQRPGLGIELDEKAVQRWRI